MRQQSLAIVGAQFANKGKGPTRLFGISLCRPGDPIELRREPRHEFDENAIAIFGQDMQLGYVKSERAAWLAPMLDRGRVIVAIFQEATSYGGAIRIAFDGEVPTLPPPSEHVDSEPEYDVDPDPDFYPDEVPDDWAT